MSCNVIVSLFVLLTGCATLSGVETAYPDGWPVISALTEGCPELAGDYENKGSYSYSPRGGSHYLAYRIGIRERTIRALDAIDTIRIQPFENDEILIEALSSGPITQSRRLSFKSKEVFCDHGALAFAPISSTEADGFGATTNRSIVWVRRAVDGSLIGEESSTTVAAAFYLVPLAGNQVFWYRWNLRR